MEGCAERRAIALDSSIENVLVEAGVRAAEQLKSSRPKLSAATLNKLTNAIPLLFGVLAFAAMCTTSGMIVLSVLVVLPTAFRIWVVVHTVATSSNTNRNLSPRDESDDELPMYSVIAALHREAAVVDQLLSAIERLDYPTEKLDVIVAVEADDHGTRAAITARKHRIPIVVVPVAPAALRTKPKALNVALPFARGVFTVIYDAEDRPERNQLRRALQAFRSAGNDLACVQARLCTDTKMTWLSRYFSAEYAGHFDIFLPRLAALGLPLPLGGSSNHFRTATLREVGGWDPHNVTEDADLGMRFARFGYRSGVIDSTTYEEAPTRIGAWLGQRTRWFKGWMQTWLVHMRKPGHLFRELGCAGFLTFQFVVGGNALVAMAHPAFLWTGLGTHPAVLNRRSPGRLRSPGTLSGRCRVRLLRIGLFRRPRPLAARHVEQDACIDPDARALVAAFTGSLVGRAGAHEEALFLEKDRTRGRQSIAAGEQNSCPPRTRALPRRVKASRSTPIRTT